MNALAEPQMNATPLIDVLLVLLVMLIFTLPVATHAVKLNLPQGLDGSPSPSITIDIDFDGRLYWNGDALPRAQMDQRLREAAAAYGRTRVKIVPDRRTPYDDVAQVLAAAQRAGVSLLQVAPIF